VELSNRRIALLTNKQDKSKLAMELAVICEKELGDDAQAVGAYRKALDFDPANEKAQSELRRLLEGGGHWRELARALEDELKSIPADKVDKQIEVLYRLGQVKREQLNRSSEAALAYEGIIERRPTETKALDALESLYQSLGRDKELLRVLELREGEGKRNTELLRRIAELRQKTSDVVGAVRAYAEAFVLEPSSRDTFTALEKLCYGQELWSDAIELYDVAIERVESGEIRSYRLGDLYSRRGQVLMQYVGDVDGAVESFEKVLEVAPNDDAALANIESMLAKKNDWHRLLKVYEGVAAQDTEKKEFALRAAAKVAREQLDDLELTAGFFLKIIEVAPADAKAIDFLESHYGKTQQWNELVLVLEKQLEGLKGTDERELAPLLQRLAKVSEEGLRDEERAIRYYQRLVDVAPQNRRALDALSRIYESTERWSEFVEVTRRQTKVTKDRNVKALLYFKCGSVMEAKFNKEDEAIRYYDAAIKTSPACLPAVHGMRDLYLRRKDWPRVIQTLELEVKLWQDDKERAGVFAQIGRIYGEELNQPDRAMHYYESALAVDPDCVPANRALFEHFFDTEQWDRAEPLAHALAQKAMRDGDPARRSEFYRRRGIVAWKTGEPVFASESIVIALEILPDNIDALDALINIAIESPQAYDFPATFRELDKIYRRRPDCELHSARVKVAQASEQTRAGDLAAAETLLGQAIERCPSDFRVVDSLVSLHVSVRNWSRACEVIDAFAASITAGSGDLTEALLRKAEILADGQMDSRRAVEVLQRIIAQDAKNPEVFYRLAQELFCLQEFAAAREAIEKVIELSAAPGVQLSPERLARYYYYLGKIIEASGESRSASSQYRRAAEYDPQYAPPALALAMRAAAAGEQASAERSLIEAAHAAMEVGGESAAVPLQRGLARILLSGGDRNAAIEAYRGILAVEPDGAADRLALAEIYASTDLRKAISEVARVIQSDLRNGPAYRTLAGYYLQAGEALRAHRIVSAMELLGYVEPEDRELASRAMQGAHSPPLQSSLTAELHNSLLINDAVRSPVGQLFSLASVQLSALFPQHSLGDNLTPLNTVGDSAFQNAAVEMARLFRIEPEIYVGENVPGVVAVISSPRQIAVFDRRILNEPEAGRRFALGWAFEGIVSGFAMLLQLGQRQRTELGSLLQSMFLSPDDRAAQTNEFIAGLSKPTHDLLERHEGTLQDFDVDDWVDGINAVARRAGLLACDSLQAATHILALLAGENVGAEQSAALGTVFCGADLFNFYVGDDYHRLRDALGRPPAGLA
jgi:tetratricopeptide (TPR) repeat protein